MFFELVCSCSATFHMEADEDESTAAWLFAHRFVNAHAKCGYMTAPTYVNNEVELPEKTQKNVEQE